MTVCLIVPPSPFLLDERVFMSLGILKVAAVLEQHSINVHVLDLSGIANCTDVISDYCAGGTPTAFGITATTPQLPIATRIAQTIRGIRPNVRLIFGGPHPTLVHAAARAETLRQKPGRAQIALQQLYKEFDVIVAGDGEFAMLRALEPHAPRLIDADDPASDLFHTSCTLESLPFPARHLVDVQSYHYQIDGIPALSIIAQLGCPFGCSFCGGRISPFLRRVRSRSSQHVVAELVHLYQTYGTRGFMFYDDELNVNPSLVQLMEHITKAQEQLGVEFRLRGFLKAELFTSAQAQAMKRAGFRWILVGFESGSPRILTNINKKAAREQNTRCVAIARDHGLKVKALMSIGHPGESEQTIAETTQWLTEIRPDDFDVALITIYPGSPYYDDAVPHMRYPGQWTYIAPRTGDHLHSINVDYRHLVANFKGRPDGGYQSFVYTDHLTPEQLVAARDRMEHSMRTVLNIPFYANVIPARYEHSMGQTNLPAHIFRASR